MSPEGGKWVVVCEDHHAVVNVATRALALATATRDFCESCE